MEGKAQENEVLTSSKSSAMSQLLKITATMNAIQAQLKNLYATSKI